GLKTSNGSWKMAWTSCRNCHHSWRDIFHRFFPRYRISPEVGSVNPSSSRASVVLPLPLSPATAINDGTSALTDSEKSFKAVVAVGPLPKTRPRPRASTSGWASVIQVTGEHEVRLWLAGLRADIGGTSSQQQ